MADEPACKAHGDRFMWDGGNDAQCVACMRLQVGELRKHLRYVCNIAERLGPKAHNTHREEALHMLDRTLKEAEEVWAKTGKRFCDCRPMTYQENAATGSCVKCGLPMEKRNYEFCQHPFSLGQSCLLERGHIGPCR